MKTAMPMSIDQNRPIESDLEPRDDALEPAACHLALKNILVPLDLSEASLKALQYAVPLAQQFGATVTLLHVVDLPVYTPELPYPPALLSETQAAVTGQLEEIRHTRIPDDVNVNTAVRHNFVFDGIVEIARAIPADLIVTTTHGRTGLMHVLLGSTAENIVRKAPCPVLVVRGLAPKSH